MRTGLFPKIQNQVDREREKKRSNQRNSIFCRIIGLDSRERTLWLENTSTHTMISTPCPLPYSEVFRVPTTQSNWVWLMVDDETGGYGGIPILMDRDYREPVIFETSDPLQLF